LHIGWGLCDRLCPVLVCRGRYGLGGLVLLFILGSILGGVGPVGVFGGEAREEGGGVRSGTGAARTILLFHITSARPSKQPLMVPTFLRVFGARLAFFVSARTNRRCHQQSSRPLGCPRGLIPILNRQILKLLIKLVVNLVVHVVNV